MFTEVADRVWVARHEWHDVNVTVVGSERGLLLVDTHASAQAAEEVVDDVRALGRGEVLAVVNTHAHHDHTFGNGTVLAAWPDALVHAHEEAAARTVWDGERVKAWYEAGGDDRHRTEVLVTEIVPATETFSSARVLDLGDRAVELVHPGRAHTDGDLVVVVPDADVVLAGDLVEESALTDATPGYGADCYPLEWPLALDLVQQLLGPRSVVVPGHGAVVDRDFVVGQRSDIGVVAETIRDLAGRGVPVGEALASADWPFPAHRLAEAVRRGYDQLPRAQKRLPLI